MAGRAYTSLTSLQTQRYQWHVFALITLGVVLLSTWHRHSLPVLLTLDTLGMRRYCENDLIGKGMWMPEPVDGHTWARLKASAGYTCHDHRHALMCFTNEPSELPRLAAANGWRWQPHDCQLRPFDSTTLLRRLGRNARQGKRGSGILFVGDSLQLQQSQSFECMMGAHIEEGFLTDYEVGNFTLEDGAGQVGFVRCACHAALALAPDPDGVQADPGGFRAGRNDYVVQPETWSLMMPNEPEPADIGRFARECSPIVPATEAY